MLYRGILLTMLVLSLTSGISAQNSLIPGSWAPYLAEAEKLGANQLLLVISEKAGQSRAILHCLQFSAGKWEYADSPMPASTGRKGIADPGKKREGDGMSPYGIFPISMAFGNKPVCLTKMPYQQMFKEDIWVDDPSAKDYNRLVKIDSTQAKSFEHMLRNDDLYNLGLVVEYNTNPVIPRIGSAIFIHFWGKPFRSTAGCLGLSQENLEKVLAFLEPDKKPFIGFFRKDL